MNTLFLPGEGDILRTQGERKLWRFDFGGQDQRTISSGGKVITDSTLQAFPGGRDTGAYHLPDGPRDPISIP